MMVSNLNVFTYTKSSKSSGNERFWLVLPPSGYHFCDTQAAPIRPSTSSANHVSMNAMQTVFFETLSNMLNKYDQWR